MSSETAHKRRSSWAEQGSNYEYRVLTIDPLTPQHDAYRIVTDEAEYGRWELARTLKYSGGMRRIWLRRKIIRVTSTL